MWKKTKQDRHSDATSKYKKLLASEERVGI